MILYIIRHAQSENNRLYDLTGSSKGRSDDPALTRLGVRQATRLASYLQKHISLTHLYTSPMLRAAMTAEIVSEQIGLQPNVWTDLHETGGMYLENEETGEKMIRPGMTRQVFQEKFPRMVLPAEITPDGWWNRTYESHEERSARAERFLRQVIERHCCQPDCVAVVSHGGFYNAIMHKLLGLKAESTFWFMMNNTGISRIDIKPDYTDIIYLNRVSHLPPTLIS